jgi:hypothetical protein
LKPEKLLRVGEYTLTQRSSLYGRMRDSESKNEQWLVKAKKKWEQRRTRQPIARPPNSYDFATSQEACSHKT